MDIPSFFAALFNDWVALMSGIASVVLTIVGFTKEWKGIPRWAFWAAAAICFFLASARVWTAEHNKYLDEAKYRNPQLVGEIDVVSIAAAPPEIKGQVMLFIVSVSDLGAPSIVKSWHLRMDVLGGRSRTASTQALPQTIMFNLPQGPTVLYGEDGIYNKTITPIPTGGRVSGLLMFSFPDDLTNEELWRLGNKYTIIFEDVRNKEYSVSAVQDGKPIKFPYVPGLRHP